MRTSGLFAVMVSALLAACGVEGGESPVPEVSSRQHASTYAQGMNIQGMNIQGMNIQGMNIQGMNIQGMNIQGMNIQGTVLSGVVVTPAGTTRTLSGPDLIGATLTGVDASGEVVQFTIADAALDPGDPSGEIWLYTVLYYNVADGAWENACSPDPAGAQLALPLAGVWDSTGAHRDSADQFTFGCTSGVAAKCVRWGYKPWKSVGGVSLGDYHQACTRMARADYCGNGTPHTRNGTLIDVYDRLGIQTRVAGDGMLFEAAWLPQGAYCVSKARWNLISLALLLECPGKLALPGLGDLLNPDSCIMKFTHQDRSAVLMSDRSYIELFLQLGL